MKLQGKSALVTGSTQGIGYAIAASLASDGARIFINGRTEARVKEAVEKLRRAVPGAEIHGAAANLGTARGAEELFKKVEAVDILVNNVGIFDVKPVLEIPDEDWLRFFRSSHCAVRASAATFPVCRKRAGGASCSSRVSRPSRFQPRWSTTG